MPIYSIAPAGQFGVISDLQPHEIPLNAWTSAQNVHFAEGYAEKVHGYRSLFGGASITPYFLTSVRPLTGTAFWVYAGENSVYAYDAAHYNITRAAGVYSSTGKLKWQGGVMNGLLYLNNGIDNPQVWSPATNTTKLVDLPNWPVNTKAAVIRSFKNFMVALDITKGTTRDGRLIKWSHPAPVGTYPTSWNEADTTKDAGEYSLSETEGMVIDSLPLRDVNVIYKDDSIWGMSYVGGTDIFRFFNIFRNIGIVNKNCAVEFQTGQHLILSRDDVFVHDGQVPVAILRDKVRRRLYDNLDFTNAGNSYVTLDAANTEVWICYPETGNTYANKALIWNWKKNTFGFRNLPGAASIGIGIADITAGSDIWSASADTWNSDAAIWGQTVSNPAQTRLVMAVPYGNYLHGFTPDTTDANGFPFNVFLGRTGIGIPFDEGLPPDISTMKFCTNIYPQITGTIGGVVQVRFGVQMDLSDDPTWGSWQDYTIGSTREINVIASGRLFAIEFRSSTSISWKLQGYSLEVQKLGKY
jgi:hypothetical protein